MWEFLGKLTTGQVSLIIVCLLIIILVVIMVFGPDLIALARARWTKNDEQKTWIDLVIKNIEGVKDLVETQIQQQNKVIEKQGEQIIENQKVNSEIATAVEELTKKVDDGFRDIRRGLALHTHPDGEGTPAIWDGKERRSVGEDEIEHARRLT